MFNLDAININITQMRVFIAVVECDSFTRASRLLNMTQSAVSKNIAALEDYLGFQLFIRDKKRLILTETGRYLYMEWLDVLSHIDQSIDVAKSLQGGYAQDLRIGILSTHKPGAYLYPILEIYKIINPDINVHVEDCPSEEVRSKLINGEFDIAFNVLYDMEELGNQYFNSKVIRRCPLAIGMLKTCPLAKKEEVTLEDLKDYNFVSISARFTPAYYNMLKSLCVRAGFQPNIISYTNNASSQLLNLRSNRDLFVADRFYTSYGDPYFEWRPIKDTSSGVTVSWKTDNIKKGLLDFLDAIDEFTSVSELF
ncbi:MAG: LysR family transcriptional regulator [Lachnospiraceae bacterium]|nr:LysR family transcriptional regulator [Lachnospiraceae bacterium]